MKRRKAAEIPERHKTYNPPNLVLVVRAIILKGGKFPILRRRLGQSDGGLWEFPGGKVDGGETTEKALIEEVFEETRIVVRPLEDVVFGDEYINGTDSRYPGLLYRCEVRVCLVGQEALVRKSHEHTAVRWVGSFSEARSFKLTRFTAKALEKIEKISGGDLKKIEKFLKNRN